MTSTRKQKPAPVASPTTALETFALDVAAVYVERYPIIEAMLGAMIAGEHVLLIGEPGTAKSALVRCVADALGQRYFETLLTRYTGPDEVFGPISLKGLEQDRFRRVTTGRLPEAEVVFLDEVFKASSAILNTLLGVMNERVMHDDGKALPLPLDFLVGASNELPRADDGLGAFADRFLVRLHVPRLSDDGARAALFAPASGPAPQPRLSPLVVQQLRAIAEVLPVTPAAVDALVAVRREVAALGIAVSDRRWKKAVGYLRARAAMAGATEVGTEQVMLLGDVLWSKPEEAEQINVVLQKHAAPWMQALADMTRMLDEQRKVVVDAGGTKAGPGRVAALGTTLELIGTARDQLDAIAKQHPGARPRARAIEERLDKLAFDVMAAFQAKGLVGGGAKGGAA